MTFDLLLKRVIFCLSMLPLFLFANPSGEQVISGAVTCDRTTPDTLNVMQSTSKAIIEWQDFSIAAGELTQFFQPSSNSAVLNRVVGENLSEIHGSLVANGHVFLINQNGIVIGPNGSIKTNGFFASTHDLDNGAFYSGVPKKKMWFTGDSVEEISNEGRIEALQGDIFLIAREIDNSGDLIAPNGTVGLEAGMEILIVNPKDHCHIAVKVKGDGQLSQTGNIQALNANLQAVGGNIYALAINLEGNVEAVGAEEVGGEIILSCKEGVVSVGANLEARKDDKGGKIHILAKDITLQDSARINANGDAGGGTVLVGGDYRGKSSDLSVFNASRNIISKGAVIRADALTKGDGGKLIFWANRMLDFIGTATAKGGTEIGDGGFIEISGKLGYSYRPTDVSTFAYNGTHGKLLLDPSDVNIVASGTNDPTNPDLTTPYPQVTFTTPSAATLLVTDLQDALASNNVTIDTNIATTGATGIITVSTSIFWSTATTLTLNANERVYFDGSSGAITISNTNASFPPATNALAVTFQGGGTNAVPIELNAATINTVSGNINFQTSGTATGGTNNRAIYLHDNSAINSTGTGSLAGNITLTGTVTTGGAAATSNGIFIDDSNITTVDGTIGLTGTSAGTGATNIGILVQDSQISSSGSGATGTITLTGTGSTLSVGANNDGISLDTTASTITSSTGNILLTGTGGGTGAASANVGIRMAVGTVSSTGTGASPATITFTGQGGLGSGDNSHGTFVNGSSTQVTSVNGSITLEGHSTSTAGSFHKGVAVTGGAKVLSTGTGSSIGQVQLNTDSNALGSTSIAGVFISGTDSSVISANGNISMTATSGGTGISAIGIMIATGGLIQSSEQTSDTNAATIMLTGQGGFGTAITNATGVNIEGTVESYLGNIIIMGTGGGDASSVGCPGVLLTTALLRSLGTDSTTAATIQVTGTGGATSTSTDMRGICIDSTSNISTIAGDMTLTGTGGALCPTDSQGIYINGGASITTTGAGDLNITGTTGAAATSLAPGIHIVDSGILSSSLAADAGTITMEGIVPSGAISKGFFIDITTATPGDHSVESYRGNISVTGRGRSDDGVTISTTNTGNTGGIRSATLGSANISVTGRVEAGTPGDGVNLNAAASTTVNIYTVGSGSVTINGLGQATRVGMLVQGAGTVAVGNASQTGDINFQLNNFTFPATFTAIDPTANITFQGEAVTNTIEVGGAAPSGGILNLDNATLAIFEASTPANMVIGSTTANSGTLTINGFTLGSPYIFRHFNVVTATAPLTIAGNDATMTAVSGLTIATATGITGASGTPTVTLESQNTGLTFQGTASMNAGAGNLILKANILTWSGTTPMLAGTGALTIQPYLATTSICVGGGSGTMSLGNAEIAFINSGAGFSSISIGDASGTHAIEIGDGVTGVSAFSDPLVIQGGATVNINALSALTAGTNNDITISGNIINLLANSNLNAAGTGDATLNITGSTGGTVSLNDTVTETTFAVNGGSLNDTFNVNINGITATVNGTSGSNTLVGPSVTANSWTVTGANAGTLANVTFSNIQNLTGSATQDDAFVLNTNSASIAGVLDGGSSSTDNTLNYQNWSPSALVNLAAGTGNGIGGGFVNIDEILGNTFVAGDIVKQSIGEFSEVITSNQATNNPNQLGTMEAVLSRDSGSQGLIESFGVLMNAASITPLSVGEVGTISGGQMLREVNETTLDAEE